MTLCMRGHLNRENREVLLVSILMPAASVERSENVPDGKSDMNANRNSDESIVPTKKANNDDADSSAEPSEERDSTKRNAEPSDLPRSQNRNTRKSLGLLVTQKRCQGPFWRNRRS